ncbi:MAG: HEAT repeat domain-containing protein, partial [Chloroflexota bacterium]|nr:HEAT repeat domain-containing protein [Chloroflexota bacterium]
MLITLNRFILTCLELEYQNQPGLTELVQAGQLGQAVLAPFSPEQRREFIEHYIEVQGASWQYTAGQVLQALDRSRLRFFCTNPMMLSMVMDVIEIAGVKQTEQLDTRGRIVREYVARLMQRQQAQLRGSNEGVSPDDVLQLLGRIAYIAHCSRSPNAILLPISTEQHRNVSLEEATDGLLRWLEEQAAQTPIELDTSYRPYERSTLLSLLEYARRATLITINAEGILSFRHELIATYFVAEYFAAHVFPGAEQDVFLSSLAAELLFKDVAYWSETVALWAGLLDNSAELADQFVLLAQQDAATALKALTLSILCVGVAWIPPQADRPQQNVLPQSVADAVAVVAENTAAREELARLFTSCAEQGVPEIYSAVLVLFMVEGTEFLFPLLNTSIVLDLLFTYLYDTIDNIAYEAQVKRLCRVLGKFGATVVEQAVWLNEPAPERSVRLRSAAINILGRTAEASAVAPLIKRLHDTEQFLVDRAINGLMRLGPELSLAGLSQEIEHAGSGPLEQQIHKAILTIVHSYLDEQGGRQTSTGTLSSNLYLTAAQYQQIVDIALLLLTAAYASETEVQQQARTLLVQQGQMEESIRNESAPVLNSLILSLSSNDEILARNIMRILQEIGNGATAYLIDALHRQPTETVRARIVEVLTFVRNPQALSEILQLVADPSQLVQQQVVYALDAYSPESIPGLIHLVLTSPDERVATRAANILARMDTQVVVPIAAALSPVVPERTGILVSILERVPDARAIPALTALLHHSRSDAVLIIVVINALGHYRERRIVLPLLDVLDHPSTHVYEKAIDALSVLGDIALDDLIAALNVQEETMVTTRIRRAILGMVPFPAEQLIAALEYSNPAQIEQICTILRMQGADAAHTLVRHLFHKNTHVQNYIRATLTEMPGAVVVPALLEVLGRPGWLPVITD